MSGNAFHPRWLLLAAWLSWSPEHFPSLPILCLELWCGISDVGIKGLILLCGCSLLLLVLPHLIFLFPSHGLTHLNISEFIWHTCVCRSHHHSHHYDSEVQMGVYWEEGFSIIQFTGQLDTCGSGPDIPTYIAFQLPSQKSSERGGRLVIVGHGNKCGYCIQYRREETKQLVK